MTCIRGVATEATGATQPTIAQTIVFPFTQWQVCSQSRAIAGVLGMFCLLGLNFIQWSNIITHSIKFCGLECPPITTHMVWVVIIEFGKLT